MSKEQKNAKDLIDDLENQASNEGNDGELFAEDMEDRFNAKAVSSGATASSVGGTWGTLSTVCSIF